MKAVRIIVIVLLVASIAANVVLFQRYRNLDARRPYMSGEQGLIDRSIDLYVREVSAEASMRFDRRTAVGPRFPVVTYTDNERCVNLMLPRGYVGFIPFYCYDNRGRLVRRGRI